MPWLTVWRLTGSPCDVASKKSLRRLGSPQDVFQLPDDPPIDKTNSQEGDGKNPPEATDDPQGQSAYRRGDLHDL